MTAPRIVLSPEAVALYRSGATVGQVAQRFGCSWDGARNALVRAHVDIRQQVAKNRTPLIVPRRPCRDCGERLDLPPHPMGRHLPGCSHGTVS